MEDAPPAGHPVPIIQIKKCGSERARIGKRVGLKVCGERHGSTHVHLLPNPIEQFCSIFNQLGKQRIIFIHVPLVLGNVAPLMTQRE